MTKTILSPIASMALALFLVLPFGVAAGSAQDGCWDNAAIQSALAEGRIQPVAAVLAREGIDPSTEVLSVRVCEEGGVPIYVLAVLESSGQARNLMLGAY